jgi:sulfite reductase (NADPH) flavoprotein alpha-component
MAAEVDATLKDIVREHGGMGAAEADAWVEAMRKSRRYQRDVY